MKRVKTGGRQKGTPNKTTLELKQKLHAIITSELEEVETILESLSDKDRLEMIVKLLPYVVPKQHDIALGAREEITISFED